MTTRALGRRAMLLAWCLAFLSLHAVAGTTGKIAGRVLDQNKEPLPSANVVVAGTSLGAVSDLDGYYAIINVPPGRYEVQFRLVGYRAFSVKQVQVSVNNTTKLDATLQEEVITAEDVVVTASRPVVEVGLTSTIATVTDDDIKSLPVQELQDIVSLQAGVVTAGDDVHFRGGRAGEVQYQVNGSSVNNVYDNKSTVRIDRSLIQEVQVITGTFDAEYGQAMSGVVNTVLKSGGETFQWNVEAYLGDWVYPDGGERNLTDEFYPTSQQNLQASVSGPTGLPQTTFLLSGRRFVFTDYLYGTRTFVPTDRNDFEGQVAYPTGDGETVALGYTKEWSGLGKITNRSIEAVELSYQILFNSIDGRRQSFQWRLNPDGTTTQHTTSIVHGLDMTHTLSSSAFYTLSVRQNYFDYTDWVYEDFYDQRYDAAGQARSLSNEYEYGAVVQGVDFNRFQQKTNSWLFKGNVTSQISRSHQLKAGGEIMTSSLQFGTPGTLTYRNVGGRDSLVRIVDQPPDFPGVQEYSPVSGAAYVHDLIEWHDLTIRAGLRFEYFDANSTIPSDLQNPANAIEGAPPSSPQATTVKTSLAPRLGVSYPITDRSSIFFSYGHFYQFPPLKDIFGNSNYDILARIQAGSEDYGVMGNPDIKPERTVQYEFGYKHAVTDRLGVSMNIFYKDIRDLLGVEFVSTYNDASYARLTNIDYGSVTGFTLSLDQRRIGLFSAVLDYTWQYAQGNSSDPRETAQLKESGRDARPRQVPFNWDQRHTLNLTLQLSEPGDWSVSSIARYGSGLPYTPAIGSGFGSQIETNSGRKPNGLLVDLRADKTFALGGVGMNVFLRVFNLFNARYFNGMVFSTTGSPDYSLQPATDRNALADPTRYYAPRRIELGIALNSSF